jgi:hypothetical protein
VHKRKEKPNNPELASVPGPPQTEPEPGPPNRGGRPVKELAIELELVEKLASLQLKLDEIAVACKVSPATLDNRIASDPGIREAIERGRAAGRASLRRAQMASALAGNPTMQIFLGKQYLGQKDRFEHEVNANISIADRITERRRERMERDAKKGPAPDADAAGS